MKRCTERKSEGIEEHVEKLWNEHITHHTWQDEHVPQLYEE